MSGPFDIIVYGSTGFTGRLVAEYLAQRNAAGAGINWAMAGRSADKLAAVRDEIGAPAHTPMIVADAANPVSLKAMAEQAKVIITTVGPYQLYGEPLVAVCAETGTDYVDLSGEPGWMFEMIGKYDAKAKETGARIVHSCGFDSIPFDMGVWFLQEEARRTLGAPVPRVRGRVRAMKGTFSGGTAASLKATMAALGKDPSLLQVLANPFSLANGFQGPEQPSGNKPMEDPAIGAWVAPFIMAPINTKNVHRSNALMDHSYGTDFVYDEMMVTGPGDAGKAAAEAVAKANPLGGDDAPKPGEGPSKHERDTGFYDVLFVGEAADGRVVRASVKGDRDPGYGSTSKMLVESALCLIHNVPDAAGGVLTPAPVFGGKIIDRLQAHAGLTFAIEA